MLESVDVTMQKNFEDETDTKRDDNVEIREEDFRIEYNVNEEDDTSVQSDTIFIGLRRYCAKFHNSIRKFTVVLRKPRAPSASLEW